MKNLVVILLACLCLVTRSWAVSPTEQKNYINNLSKMAVAEMNASGIPASIILAQAILEANWGQSELVEFANNYFGIKCSGDCGFDVYMKFDDDRDPNTGAMIKSPFRKYSSIEASFKDHSAFLQNNKRYADLFKIDKTNYLDWAIGLQAKGYATSKSYAFKLVELIEKHQLNRFDKTNNPIPIIKKQQHTMNKIPDVFVLPKDYVPICMKSAKGKYTAKGLNTHTNENYIKGFIQKNIRIVRHKPQLAIRARK